jgi:Protein of unknown function (DUF3300)
MKRNGRMTGWTIRRGLGLLLSLSLCLTGLPEGLLATQDASAPPASSRGTEYAAKTPEQLQQLVAPIALYPDSLVAQILAAATYPEQVVEADRWVQAHPNLKGDALAKAVNQQPWDPSVRALTAFPSVLGKMDKDLSWTSALGDAYFNQEADVMEAVQVMRQKAQKAGNLKTTPQQVVKTEDSTIIIEPATTEVVYVPEYNPTVVYYQESDVSFEVGVVVGFLVAYEWSWWYWGCDWHHHYSYYHHDHYYSRSRTYYNREAYYRRERERREEREKHEGSSRDSNRSSSRDSNRSSSHDSNRPSSSESSRASSSNSNRPSGESRSARGYGESRGQSNGRSGAFSNYDHGGTERSFSARGAHSLGGFPGGGPPHGGPPHR